MRTARPGWTVWPCSRWTTRTRQAIEDALAWVGRTAEPGSGLVFSYIRDDVIEDGAATATERRVMARAKGGGAPWRTGLDPADVPALLARYGLHRIEEVGGEDYRERYLASAGRDLATLRAERVVLAEVSDGKIAGSTAPPEEERP